MFSQEEFAKQTIESFNSIREEIAEIKEDYFKLHEKIAIHLKVEEELEDYKEKLDKKSNKKFYYMIAVFGVGFTIYEILEKIFFFP